MTEYTLNCGVHMARFSNGSGISPYLLRIKLLIAFYFAVVSHVDAYGQASPIVTQASGTLGIVYRFDFNRVTSVKTTILGILLWRGYVLRHP
jgi:hypothetical protein